MNPRSLEDFGRLVAADEFELARACLEVASDSYPTLDVDAGIARLEAMASAVRARLADDAFAEQKLAALNHYLFEELGFRGNTAEYYDPRNSYLNEVLDRRLGIPITLAIVYMEIGRRIGLPIEGVSFPGHFLVKLRVSRGQLVLDPFERGAPQSEESLRARLAQLVSKGAVGRLESYLAPAPARLILARVLRNLKAIHLERADHAQSLAVTRRLVLVLPDAPEELRDRGLAFERLEAFRAALADLEGYLKRRPDARDATEIRARVVELTARCARLN